MIPLSVLNTIGTLLSAAMNAAVANGANSISMPDQYVELAFWLQAQPEPQSRAILSPLSQPFLTYADAQAYIDKLHAAGKLP